MAKGQQDPTDYVVLQYQVGSDSWRQINRVSARSRAEAIKLGYRTDEEQEGSFKAIPLRSWELTVDVRTETKVVAHFSEASADEVAFPKPEPAAA